MVLVVVQSPSVHRLALMSDDDVLFFYQCSVKKDLMFRIGRLNSVLKYKLYYCATLLSMSVQC